MVKKNMLQLGLLICALQASSAMALTLWDNGGPSTTVANQGSSNLSDTQQAQDFTLTFTSDLTAVRFWNLEASPADYVGSIFYQITGNNAGVPGAVLGFGTATPTRTAAGTVLGFNQFQNDFALSVNNLAAGTYWITLHNGPLASTTFTDFSWSWADLDATNTPTVRGQEFLLNPPGTQWTTNDQEHAFNITGIASVVPEPAAWLLAGAAFATLTLRRRRTV